MYARDALAIAAALVSERATDVEYSQPRGTGGHANGRAFYFKHVKGKRSKSQQTRSNRRKAKR